MADNKTNTNITLWKQHLPCRVRFATKPQHAEAPGPKQHTGILFDVKLKTGKGKKNKSTYEFYVLYNDPLNIKQDGTIDIIQDVTKRPLKVFTGFQFIMTCYYNWDVQGRLAPTTRYLRDFRSQYTEVETKPNTWTTMRDILRTPDPDVPLNINTLPTPNPRLIDITKQFNASMCIERSHLYGRGGGSGAEEGNKKTKPIKVKAKRTRTQPPKKRGRKPKKADESFAEEEEEEEEEEDDTSDEETSEVEEPKEKKTKTRRTKKTKQEDDDDDEWLPKHILTATQPIESHLVPYQLPIYTPMPTIIPSETMPTHMDTNAPLFDFPLDTDLPLFDMPLDTPFDLQLPAELSTMMESSHEINPPINSPPQSPQFKSSHMVDTKKPEFKIDLSSFDNLDVFGGDSGVDAFDGFDGFSAPNQFGVYI